MTTSSSKVEVRVDPVTAFRAFTDEMDLWWVRGPINFHSDGGRVVEIRCEPGVGGRIMEVLDDHTEGEVFERARITFWDPPARLEWESCVDDVLTTVTFLPSDEGTVVTVEHTIPDGGEDRGGTSWSRVVPAWFGAWCAKRDRVEHVRRDIARLSLALTYARPVAAAHWLRNVFGFASVDELPATEEHEAWIEFHVGNAAFHLFAGDEPVSARHVPWVYVDDVHAHFDHAKRNGATIVEEIHGFAGSPVYTADDLEGNRWTFLQARPTMR